MRGNEKHTICRLCLTEKVELIGVFESKGIPGWTAADAIKEFLLLQVSASDVYPQCICIECMLKFEDFKLFLQQCERNKDLLDRAYAGNRIFDGTEEVVDGMAVCSNEHQSELQMKKEDFEIPVEKDPLELSGADTRIKSEIEVSSIDSKETPSSDVSLESADQIYLRMKCELEGQGCSVYTDEINIPHTTEEAEATTLNEEYPVVNGPSENILYPDHGESEEVLDIKTESCSDESIVEVISGDSETELSVNYNAGISKEETGCSSYMSASDVHSSWPQNGPVRVSGSSDAEDFFRNEDEVNNSYLISSLIERNLGCSVSQDVQSGQEPIMLRQHRDQYSAVYSIGDHERVCKCMTCFKIFRAPDDLRNHMLNHSREKQFLNVDCSAVKRQTSSLVTKIDIRSGDRRFKCKECPKSFHLNKYLWEHMKIHSGVRPYECNQCRKYFTQKSNLVTHMRIHSGEKPFKCDQCSKSFAQKTHLQNHLRIHSGERPFQCNRCSKNFNRKDTLKEHMMTHFG